MTIQACCKINIGLNIIRRRADGFHDISTIMYPLLELYDTVSVNKRPDTGEVSFTNTGLAIDCPAEKNLCVKAARLMQSHYDIGGVEISLNKVVPFGAGLGGGSSDATAVLVAINSLFNLNLDEQTLISHAASLGSDTAFFVRRSAQLCSGRGEIMTPSALDLSPYTIALVKPEVHISTAEAYGGVSPQLPPHPLEELITQPLEEWQNTIHNDFERHIFKAHPELGEIKQQLLNSGATYAAMSGSGSTIYGIFKDEDRAKELKLELLAPSTPSQLFVFRL